MPQSEGDVVHDRRGDPAGHDAVGNRDAQREQRDDLRHHRTQAARSAHLRSHNEARRPPEQRREQRRDVHGERRKREPDRPERDRELRRVDHREQRGEHVGQEVTGVLVGNLDGPQVEEQECERQYHVAQVRQTGEPVHEAQRVLDAARTPHAVEERPAAKQDLEPAARPPVLLAEVTGHVHGTQPGRQHLGHVDRRPAQPLEHQRDAQVFGDGVLGQPADLVERSPAEDDVRTAREDGVCGVLAAQDGAVEERLLFVRAGSNTILEPVAVRLRGLHERHAILGETRHGALEESRLRCVVRVEDHHELTGRDGQGVVDVAGLRADAVRAGQIRGATARGQGAYLLAGPVVEHPDLQTRVPHRRDRSHGVLDHVDGLAVDGDERIDVLGATCEVGIRRIRPRLVRDGVPEAHRLDQVEQLGSDEQRVQHRVGGSRVEEQPP